MRRWGIAAVVGLALVAPALADTGGRMGGGDWGSPSNSSPPSGGSWSSSPSSSWGGDGGGDWSSSSDWSSSRSYSPPYVPDRSTSYGDGTPPNVPIATLFVLLSLGTLGLLGYGHVIRPRLSAPNPYAAAYPGEVFEGVDVSVLRVALDGRARKFVQTELRRIASIADTATAEGRATMLREVTLLLRRVRDAWVYGGAVNAPMRAPEAAKAAFDRHVDDARARFRHETVTNVQGERTMAAAPSYVPRAHEGEGLILVTIVVAARSELFTVAHIGDGEDLRKALEAASHRPPRDLVAIEILWQPTEDGDRLSSLELEAKHPHPALLPIRNALVGKVFCAYCGGPFPAELVACPHCGGSAAARGA